MKHGIRIIYHACLGRENKVKTFSLIYGVLKGYLKTSGYVPNLINFINPYVIDSNKQAVIGIRNSKFSSVFAID